VRGQLLQAQLLPGMLFDPQRRLHRAAAVGRARRLAQRRVAVDHRSEPCGERQRRFVEADVAVTHGRRAHQLAAHHQLGQRRHAARRPRTSPRRQLVDHLGRQEHRQAVVAAGAMLVRATVLVARLEHQHRAGHQLVRAAVAAATEAAALHVRHRPAVVMLPERRRTRAGIAAVGRDGDRSFEQLAHLRHRQWRPAARSH